MRSAMRSQTKNRCSSPLFLFACLVLFAHACTSGRVDGGAPAPSAAPMDDDAAAPTGDPDPVDSSPGDDTIATAPPGMDDASPASADGDDAPSSDAFAPSGDAAGAITVAPPFDTGEGGVCVNAPGPGDLLIDELMIASVAGTGDHGEWFEVTSTLGCAFDLRGLRGNAPSGSKVQTFAIGDDAWIPAFGTFVVADSSIAAINHDVPGLVVVWAGQPGDVLRNQGATVTLQFGDVIVDTVTYPSMTLIDGVSLAFPPDCELGARTDWTKWQPSTASWFPGFHGTPNAPNIDVRCP